VSARPVDPAVAEMPGAAALPRANGELVFDAPWQSRAFGMAVSLYRGGVYEWDRFRERLIAEIARGGPDDGGRYYERWLEALERLLREDGVVGGDELEARVAELAAHDEHEHDHHHD
jgi:nitrile hydratase accessory protein